MFITRTALSTWLYVTFTVEKALLNTQEPPQTLMMVTRYLFTSRHAATFNETSIFNVLTEKIHEIRRWNCQFLVRDDYSF